MVAVFFQDLVDEEVAAHDHRCVGRIFSGIASPHQDLVDPLAVFGCRFHGDIGASLVVHPLAVTVVAVGVNQDATAGIGGAEAACLARETAEDDGGDYAGAGTSHPGNWELPNHWALGS